MKKEWIDSMSVPYDVLAVSADYKSVIAETNSGAIYQISRATQDRITKTEFDEGVAQGTYRIVERPVIRSIDEIREYLALLKDRSIQLVALSPGYTAAVVKNSDNNYFWVSSDSFLVMTQKEYFNQVDLGQKVPMEVTREFSSIAEVQTFLAKQQFRRLKGD